MVRWQSRLLVHRHRRKLVIYFALSAGCLILVMGMRALSLDEERNSFGAGAVKCGEKPRPPSSLLE